ncbi:GAF domain-containing protein [Flavobacterium sp.]|uniref:GAF domain-containing protein n=1 Tax=Flavobacterium sp. TaxID=239 RepID=UPI00260C4A47|nr:GAF domain-containing protein [Flavobacterium sp.]
MDYEDKRIEELLSYQILNSSTEDELDDITEMASLICDFPISLITLLDDKVQWIKSKKGIEIENNDVKDSFCKHTLDKPDDIFVVENAAIDPLFKDNPIVQNSPNINFYAGVPLVSKNGFVLGTLCVLDHKPRTITENQKKTLQILAKKAMQFLTTRKLLLNQRNEINTNALRLKKLTDNVPGGIFQLKMAIDGSLSFEFISKGMLKLHPSVTMEQWMENPEIGFSLIHPNDLDDFKIKLMESFEKLTLLSIKYRVKKGKSYVWHLMKGNPERMHDGSVIWYGNFQNINDRVEYEIAMEQIAFDISHVLRRPIANLIGLTELLDKKYTFTDNQILEYVGYIKTVSLEMETFTRDLDEIYRLKKEKITGYGKDFYNKRLK